MLAFRYPLWKLSALIDVVAIALACVRYNRWWSRLILMVGFLVPSGVFVRKALARASSQTAWAAILFCYLAVLAAFGLGIVMLLSILQHPRI